MKKKILSALLSFAMILTLVPIMALADGIPFTDVKTSDWFYADVENAYMMGLINGKSDTTFEPESNLTYAEAVKLAACMNQKYITGSVSFETSNPWYKSYVDYAKKNKIIANDYKWDENATRAGYISIFANALPDDALAQINIVEDGLIPDVPMTHPNAKAIYKLYRAGIIQGVDEKYNCNPSASIMRSEVSAILTRMMDNSARRSFSITNVDKKEESKTEDKTAPLKITQQPESINTSEEACISFEVTVEGGKEPYSYQWYMKYEAESDFTKIDYLGNERELTWTAISDKVFKCVITDADGSTVTSDEATLTIEKAETSEMKVTIKDVNDDYYMNDWNPLELEVNIEGGTAPYGVIWEISNPSQMNSSNLTNESETTQQTIKYELAVSESQYQNFSEAGEDYVILQLNVWDANEINKFCSFKLHPALTLRLGAKEYQMESSQEKVAFIAQVDYGTLPYTAQWYIGANGRYDKIGEEQLCENNAFGNVFEITDYDFDEYNTDILEVYAVVTDAIGRTIQTDKHLVDIFR